MEQVAFLVTVYLALFGFCSYQKCNFHWKLGSFLREKKNPHMQFNYNSKGTV